MYKNKGFTLIELLVVISIIGILSSVVLAALSSARDKGNVAAGLAFDDTMYHAMGDTALGVWNFGDCSGSTVKDWSANGADLTIQGTPVWSTNAVNGGCSFSSVSGTYLFNSTNLTQDIPSITYSIWVNAANVSSQGILMGKASRSELTVQAGGNIQARFACTAGAWSALTAGSYGLPLGKWYMVSMTVDSTNQKMIMYINGRQVEQVALGCPSMSGTADSIFRLGAESVVGANPFVGLIDNARVYNKAATAMEIQNQYFAELPQHVALSR